jgi:hypothetical protein
LAFLQVRRAAVLFLRRGSRVLACFGIIRGLGTKKSSANWSFGFLVVLVQLSCAAIELGAFDREDQNIKEDAAKRPLKPGDFRVHAEHEKVKLRKPKTMLRQAISPGVSTMTRHGAKKVNGHISQHELGLALINRMVGELNPIALFRRKRKYGVCIRILSGRAASDAAPGQARLLGNNAEPH